MTESIDMIEAVGNLPEASNQSLYSLAHRASLDNEAKLEITELSVAFAQNIAYIPDVTAGRENQLSAAGVKSEPNDNSSELTPTEQIGESMRQMTTHLTDAYMTMAGTTVAWSVSQNVSRDLNKLLSSQ